MSKLPTLESPFFFYQRRLSGAAAYIEAVTPYVVQNPASLRVLVDGSIVLAIAYLEDFLGSILGLASHHRQAALRRFFGKHGSTDERARAATCDLPALIGMARRRLSFKKQGAPIERIFSVLFGCSPWPSDGVRDVVLDLVLIRHMIVHAGGAEAGIGRTRQYAAQLRRTEVLTVRAYGEYSTYHVDPWKALLLYRDAMVALESLLHHLRKELVESDRWQLLP